MNLIISLIGSGNKLEEGVWGEYEILLYLSFIQFRAIPEKHYMEQLNMKHCKHYSVQVFRSYASTNA